MQLEEIWAAEDVARMQHQPAVGDRPLLCLGSDLQQGAGCAQMDDDDTDGLCEASTLALQQQHCCEPVTAASRGPGACGFGSRSRPGHLQLPSVVQQLLTAPGAASLATALPRQPCWTQSHPQQASLATSCSAIAASGLLLPQQQQQQQSCLPVARSVSAYTLGSSTRCQAGGHKRARSKSMTSQTGSRASAPQQCHPALVRCGAAGGASNSHNNSQGGGGFQDLLDLPPLRLLESVGSEHFHRASSWSVSDVIAVAAAAGLVAASSDGRASCLPCDDDTIAMHAWPW